MTSRFLVIDLRAYLGTEGLDVALITASKSSGGELAASARQANLQLCML